MAETVSGAGEPASSNGAVAEAGAAAPASAETSSTAEEDQRSETSSSESATPADTTASEAPTDVPPDGGDSEAKPAASDDAPDETGDTRADGGDAQGEDAETKPPTEEPDTTEPPPAPQTNEALLTTIRDEIEKRIDLRPADPREFDFKVRTVRWFGMFCSAIVTVILILGFLFNYLIMEESQPPPPSIDFKPFFSGAQPDKAIIQLGVENEALALRNKRTVGALYLRSYTQFLSITAGTILAMFGAIFVLARVDSREIRTEGGWKDFKWLMNTASPGVLLSMMGVALIAFVAYRSIDKIEQSDGTIFGDHPATGIVSQQVPTDKEMKTEAFKTEMDRALEGLRSKREDQK